MEDENAIWLIKEGLMSLTYGDVEGKNATVLLLGPGDLFGALEEISPQVNGESVVALKPTVLCRMTQEQMEHLLHKHPEIAYRVTKFSWRRIARLQERLAEIMTKSVRQRLAVLLIKLATEYGQSKNDGVYTLGLTVTHDDLARLVGSSREMVSKVMGQFRELGWIRSSRKTIELLDLPTLQKVVDLAE
jgi:CRP/FNR family cyclic AMP-dependent transcriptional regulator